MKLEPTPEEAAEFYKHLQADLEKQREADEYFIESMMNSHIPDDLFADNMDLLSEPLLSDEMSPQEYEDLITNGTPITEEELFHIIKEDEINDYENPQY